ncbi:hypothetical protein SAMN05421866_4192 [Chryseobacterium oranimense]|uniref:Uncharacterized protein n=1 Tax=Chryseobacterium oranimense TaxID=421058 RepID=A0A1M5WR05_9FLAO|nr:hypothetical protein [Chryseobacterium oranimense]SHH89938.1 hypothetical protein SAMN05421866_4192 [Chryseobacterium oranimense]
MKAIRHLKNRFEYALNGSGSMKVNQNDIDALNALIKEENTKNRNTELEDSLILFYLLSAYKVQNVNNKALLKEKDPEEIRFPLGMPEASVILNNLSSRINPKQQIIQMIADELWIYQEYERIPKDRDLYLKEMHIDPSWEKQGDFSIQKITPQEMIPIKKEDRITFEQVEELLNNAIKHAKDNFPMFKALDQEFVKFMKIEPLSHRL